MDELTDLQEMREQIVSAVKEHLRDMGSGISDDGEAEEQMGVQISGIIDDTLGIVSPSHGRIQSSGHTSYDDIPAVQSASLGQDRARKQIHPKDSLAAALVLFDLALPEITVWLSAASALKVAPMDVARALHHSIMARITPASIGYVDILLEKLALAQREERMSVSRELHDRVAHGIAAALQRVSLGLSISGGLQREEGAPLFRAAVGILERALADTREIALDLRQELGDKKLDEAVRGYIHDSPQMSSISTVHTYGSPFTFSAAVGEELFLIIREALRNAIAHSRASSILVEFEWCATNLVVRVIDDGRGFDPAANRSACMGLVTMRERSDLIGAELAIDSTVGVGVRVTISISAIQFHT